MISNYLKVAWRNIARQKLFSFINIFGLALSLSFCLLVIVIAVDQGSFDRFHPSPDRVYRLNTVAHRTNGGTEPYASSPRPLGAAVAGSGPAVETVASLTSLRGEATVGANGFRLRGFATDRSFFGVFGFTLLEGSAPSAFASPQDLLLSKETAEKLFGATSPVGSVLTLKPLGDFTVTGVVDVPPGKTHMEFDFLGSAAILPLLEKEEKIRPVTANWKNYYASYTYVRLKEGHDIDELLPVLAAIPKTHYANLDLETRDAGYTFEPQRLTGITPGPILSNNLGHAMPLIVLTILGILSVIGMVAALFNYTGLTLARSISRMKEIGIRKVAGADRRHLFMQFLVESVMVVSLSLLVAEIILQLVLIPGFRGLSLVSGMNLGFGVDFTTELLFVGLTLLTGIVAGVFPAVVISGFRPALILKNVRDLHLFSRVTLRKILLGFQYLLSLVLVIVVITIYEQFAYTQNVDYGFTRENIMSIPLQGNSPAIVAQQLAQAPGVVDVAMVSHRMGTWEDWSVDVSMTSHGEKTSVRSYSVDDRYVPTLGLELVAGKNFDNGSPGLNAGRVLVNQKFLERYGLGQAPDAVGETVWLEDDRQVQIGGVIRDFLFKPLTYELAPMMLVWHPEEWRDVLVKVRAGSADPALAYFREQWPHLDPVHPFEYTWYDDIIRDVYGFLSDEMTVIGFLAVMALTISLLGLLGIVTFNAESRKKEIGIRKVLGASVANILLLFGKQELRLLGLAAVVAVPGSLYICGMLLDSFAYRITVGAQIVLSGVLLVFVLAGLIVALRTARTASANPVGSLRYE